MARYGDSLLALVAGVLLVAMISFNSHLAKASTALFASWTAHAIGSLVSIIFLVSLARWLTPAATPNPPQTTVPLWAYAGGIAGAMTVTVAALAVNSSLGLAGTLALSLVGQIGFSLLADQFGWLGMPKRQLTQHDLISTLLIVSGSLLIIFFRG